MERQFGQSGMVRWQDRRIAPQTRARARMARLVLGMAALSAVSLMIGFYSGLPVPLGLLQTVFLLLVALFAAFGLWAGFHALGARRRRRPFI